jgi:hypothetical protein
MAGVVIEIKHNKPCIIDYLCFKICGYGTLPLYV